MPNVIYTATLDFTDNGVFNAGWRIKQGDFGSSSLNITLSDNGAIVFDDSIEPEIVFKRADGRSVISTMQSAGEDSGYYIYNFVGNELAVPGPCVVDVKIVGSDSRTSTASCRFDVVEDTIGYDETGAETYNNPVASLIDIALTKSGEAEAWAVGTRDEQPVGPGDPTYHNNSKYWSELRMGSKIKNITGRFYTTTGGFLDSCVIGFDPIQDLHGYSKPWVGGSGKNKLQLSVSRIKQFNTVGSWSGNSYVYNGVTFTILTDSDNNVIGIRANGTASATIQFYLPRPANLSSGSYILTGGISENKRIFFYNGSQWYNDTGSGISFNIVGSESEQSTVIVVMNGQTCNNDVFKPMIRLASVSDATFEPYSNICAFSGHTQVQVWNAGKNKCDPSNMGHGVRDNSTGAITSTSYTASSTTNPIKVKSNTHYVVTYDGTAQSTRIFYYDKNESFISTEVSNSFTTPNNAEYVAFQSGGTSGALDKWQLEEGSTATEYTPYNGYTKTIDLDSYNYGGTLDAVTGVLTVTHGFDIIDGSKVTGVSSASTTDTLGGKRINTNISNAKYAGSGSAIPNIISNKLSVASATDIYGTNVPNCVSVNDVGSITLRYNGASTLADAQTALNSSPVQVCYELAIPFTIQLTPTQLEALVGQNNLSAPLKGQSFASAEYRDNMSAVYITDERVVGKWIDGKDIYQRTIDLGSSGVSVPANSSASTGLTKGNVQLPIWSTAISPSGQAFPYIGCSVGSTYIMMENKTGNATTVRYFTFQYTKS